jgi:tetratricopeptide (TPR) repeat protein
MFRRLFQRNGRRQTPGPQGSGQPDQPDSADHLKLAAELLQEQTGQQKDDNVHRMVLRAGGQKPPDDPDEQAYARDQGEHAELARNALQAGDFKRSIYHLGLALASDPTYDEWLALLDQWIATRGPDALDLVPLNDEQYFATLQASQSLMSMGNTPTHRMEVTPSVGKNYHAKVAVHAYILAAQGKVKDAVALLLELMQVKSEIPYILWLPRWQDQPGFADALEPGKVASAAMGIMQKHPGTYVFSEQGRAEINLYLPLLRNTYTAALTNGQMNEGAHQATFMYAMALRKTGSFEEAVGVARALPEPSYQTLVALAMAEEASGNLDASIAAYRQALTLQPNDVPVRNDLGMLFLKQGKLTEALAFYEESCRIDHRDPYQLASAYTAYLHYLQAPSSKKWLKKLKTLAKKQGTAQRLLYLLQAPYIGQLPYPGEALINLMRGVKAQSVAGEIDLKAGETFSVGLSSLEAPSAWLAAKRMLDARGVSCEMSAAETLSPDPRQPLRPVEYQIWRYEGMDPIPAVPPPDPSIAESIAALAQTPYALDRWHAPAHALAQHLGQTALMSLLGVMVHPPAMPAGWEEWDWVIAVQIASALTIASLDTGWEGSLRKAALTSLIYGPMDWSGAAALVAMAVLARQDMRINIEFDRICCDLWRFGPGSPEWPLEEAMVSGLHFVDAYRKEAEEHIDAYFERMQREYEQEEEKQ